MNDNIDPINEVQTNIIKALGKKLLNTTEKFRIGDIINVVRTGTRGKIVRIADDTIIFRTYDRIEGWSEHQVSKNVIEKSKPYPKTKSVCKMMYKFLKKANRKTFQLTEDFLYQENGQDKILRAGEMLFVDEPPKFMDNLLVPDVDGYTPDQLHVRYGNETVFSIIKCFSVSKSHFMFIPITKIGSYAWDPTIFNKLSIPYKERIRSFLGKNPNLEQYGIKFHKGRGKSLLLFGEIGTGKTMTVEAIAHSIQQPIIRLDIEERSSMFAIHEAFATAERYNGIVFIDEADMLIADRYSGSARLEAIQILLKYLESFSGIVIFATNYNTKIDPAIENRIDMKIYYKMTEDIRTQIWKKLLPAKLDTDFDFNKHKKHDLNGRDIQKIITFAGRRAANENKIRVPIRYIEEEIIERLKEKAPQSNDILPNYFG
ncbi:MAG: ATP-binding protein [bacterium]|nr:ATP-binding protein [bacterium]